MAQISTPAIITTVGSYQRVTMTLPSVPVGAYVMMQCEFTGQGVQLIGYDWNQ